MRLGRVGRRRPERGPPDGRWTPAWVCVLCACRVAEFDPRKLLCARGQGEKVQGQSKGRGGNPRWAARIQTHHTGDPQPSRPPVSHPHLEERAQSAVSSLGPCATPGHSKTSPDKKGTYNYAVVIPFPYHTTKSSSLCHRPPPAPPCRTAPECTGAAGTGWQARRGHRLSLAWQRGGAPWCLHQRAADSAAAQRRARRRQRPRRRRRRRHGGVGIDPLPPPMPRQQ